MKATLILLTAVSAAFAYPAQPGAATPGTPQCEFSLFEKLNLGHNHDVNTGSILLGSTIIGAPKIFGSGCAPAWAVYPKDETKRTDWTPTKVAA
jgi:hypothetical protein